MMLILWLVCVVASIVVGARKGQPIGGFCWGLFLGPVGLLVVALWPDARRRCGACQGVVPEKAVCCQHCGSDLYQAAMEAVNRRAASSGGGSPTRRSPSPRAASTIPRRSL